MTAPITPMPIHPMRVWEGVMGSGYGVPIEVVMNLVVDPFWLILSGVIRKISAEKGNSFGTM